MGWAEKEAEVMLPNVLIEIKVLGTRIHSMLQSHNGSFPLIRYVILNFLYFTIYV